MTNQPTFTLTTTAPKTPTRVARCWRAIWILTWLIMLVQILSNNFLMITWLHPIPQTPAGEALEFLIMLTPITLFAVSLLVLQWERKRYVINLVFSPTEITASHHYAGQELHNEQFPANDVQNITIENTKNWRRRDFTTHHLWKYYHFTRFSFVQITRKDGSVAEYRIPGEYDHKLANTAVENISHLGYPIKSEKTGYSWWQYELYSIAIAASLVFFLVIVGVLVVLFMPERGIQSIIDYIDLF